jgi:prepilin-type N-terminal cleavage/methylation domain-containing protein
MRKAEVRPTGFTLIEVVGAVAIVGIVFLVLSTATFHGIAAEGNAQRRMAASLVADEALAEVEMQMLLSLPIEIDPNAIGDTDDDGRFEYEVVAEVLPYDPTTALTARNPNLRTPPRRSNAVGGSPEDLTMQRVQIDVFLFDEFEEPGPDDIPLASRTAFILETATINTLSPARDLPNPGANDDSDSDDVGPTQEDFDDPARGLVQ